MEAQRLVFVVTTHIKGTDKKIAVADIMEYSITEKNPLWNICMICKEQEASIWIGTAEKERKSSRKNKSAAIYHRRSRWLCGLYGRYVCILKWQQ